MKKTIQWKQTYLLTYLFRWNRLQIILVLCSSAEQTCFWSALPATCFSRVSSRISTREAAITDYREMQTLPPCHCEASLLLSSVAASLGETSAEACNYHEPTGNGSLSRPPVPVHITSLYSGHWNQFPCWCHLLPSNPKGHWQCKPTSFSQQAA